MPRKDLEARKAYQKEYAQRNKEKAYAKVKAWREANPEKWAEQNKRYAIKYPEKLVAKTIKWKINNPIRAVEISRNTRQKNAARIQANKAKYRADKRKRTPKWVDSEELWLIKEVYDLAIKRTKLFGFSWHVDHIIPLNGKKVSGLHVINNLQVIPGKANLLKNNNYVD
jgi:hypothetical protein